MTALRISIGLVAVLVIAAAGYALRNVNYAEQDPTRVERAGFVEKQATINGSRLNYAEGPDAGPPLLLIHGQLTDWRSWSRVLPELSKRYHVFAVDCYGHGRSAHTPDKYTGRALAADMNRFLTDVVGGPATVVGHSSGGLIAAILAADAPELVRAVVLEEPPFFSSVLPRATKTFNYVGVATAAHEFLRSGETDFTGYFVRHAAIWDLFKGLKRPLQKMALTTNTIPGNRSDSSQCHRHSTKCCVPWTHTTRDSERRSTTTAFTKVSTMRRHSAASAGPPH
jgi:Alpha/beta hydrolase family